MSENIENTDSKQEERKLQLNINTKRKARLLHSAKERERRIIETNNIVRQRILEQEEELAKERNAVELREQELLIAQKVTKRLEKELEEEREKEFAFLKGVIGNKKINYIDYITIYNDNSLEEKLSDNKFMKKFKNYIIEEDTKFEGVSDEEFFKTLKNRVHFQASKSIFADNLNYYFKAKGKTPSDIVKEFDISASTVSDWFNGLSFPRPDKIKLIAKFLGIPPAWLTEERTANRHQVSNTPLSKVPVLRRIPAGIPIEAIEDILDFEEIPKKWINSDKYYFALQIDGDSMYPKYEKGDIVIFQKTNYCENGQHCAVIVNGNDATFKKILKSEVGITLVPLNDNYEPVFYSNKQIRELPVTIIGVAKEIRRKLF